MYNLSADNQEFTKLVNDIPQIGFKKHADNILTCARFNKDFVKKSIKQLAPLTGDKAASCLIISAGPSVHRKKSISRILNSHYKGTLIATDGVFIHCLKAGLVPDFVLTLDPHPTRVVRWFGDPHFEQNSAQDDYFARQDLDVDFRKNSLEHNQQNIKLVDKFVSSTKMLIATTSSRAVVERLTGVDSDLYWWNPLVDNPHQPESLTKKIYEINKLPCLNTGGNVGTAAWVFAHTFFKFPKIGMVGVDYGYYGDTPYQQTQTYYELVNFLKTNEGLEKYFPEFTFPLNGEKFYIDPTYFWYRQNFIDLLRMSSYAKTYNCTEGGTLVDDSLICQNLDEFIKNQN